MTVANVPSLAGVFVPGTYLTIECEITVAVDCNLVYKCKMVGLYAHLVYWMCELFLECDSNICSVMYVKYVYSTPCHMVDGSDFICSTYVYKPLKYLPYI